MSGARPGVRGHLEIEFHLRKVQEAGCVPRLELDEEVDVAVGPEVLAQGGAVEADSTDAVSGCKGGDEPRRSRSV